MKSYAQESVVRVAGQANSTEQGAATACICLGAE
jgi:hypothetical protein